MLCSFGLAVPHTSVWWTESHRRQRTVLSSKTSLLVQGACLCGLCFPVLPPVPWPQHPRVGAGGRGVTVCVTMAASLTPPCCDAAVGTFLLSCPILQHYHWELTIKQTQETQPWYLSVFFKKFQSGIFRVCIMNCAIIFLVSFLPLHP